MPTLEINCERCPICIQLKSFGCAECSETGTLEGYFSTQELQHEITRSELQADAPQLLRKASDLAHALGAPALAEACEIAMEAIGLGDPERIPPAHFWAAERMKARC